MRGIVPAISLEPHLARLNSLDGDDGANAPVELLEEAFLLVYLLMEGRVDQSLSKRYEVLGNWWSMHKTGIVRDLTVQASLEGIFNPG